MKKRPIIPQPTVRLLSCTMCTALFVALPTIAQADMLSGGLLGHLLQGEPFTGPRVIDLIVLGLVVFLVLRLITGRTSKNQDRASQSRSNHQAPTPPRAPMPPRTSRPRPMPKESDSQRPDDDPTALQPPAPGKPDMYTMAQATWDALKSPSPKSQGTTQQTAGRSGPITPPAAASPEEEFLAGAKIAYQRILEAMAERDFNDLSAFVSPEYLAQLKNQLPATPAGHPEILLVDAILADSREDATHTTMTVDFKVLLREPGAPQNTERLERWRFTRDNTSPNGNWLLVSMERQ